MFQQQFNIAVAELLSDLGQGTKISVALDAQSTNNHLSFLAIKGYYINDHQQLQEKLLDFIPIRGRHTRSSIATKVLKVLSNTYTQKRLLAITYNNASNNTTLVQTIHLKLQDEGIAWSPTKNTIPCLAYIINLVVQDIIKYLRLAAPPKDKKVENTQRRHIKKITQQISVLNSLCKVVDMFILTRLSIALSTILALVYNKRL